MTKYEDFLYCCVLTALGFALLPGMAYGVCAIIHELAK